MTHIRGCMEFMCQVTDDHWLVDLTNIHVNLYL